MRSSDGYSPYKAATPKEEVWTPVLVDTSGALQSQPAAPDAATTPASQPPQLSTAGIPEEHTRRRRKRSIGHRRGSSSSSSRSTRYSASQPTENATADGAAMTLTDAGGRRRRMPSKERSVASPPVRPLPAPDVLGLVMPGGASSDGSTPDNKPTQETATPTPTAPTGARVGGAPSDSVVGLEPAAQVLPERGETKLEKTSVVTALTRPVLQRGTHLVAMAATAVDVPGVMANIEAAAPLAGGTASPPKDTCGLDLMQDAGKGPSLAPSHTPRVPDMECAIPQCFVAALALGLLGGMLLLFVFIVLPLLEKDPMVKGVCATRDCVLHANALRLVRSQAAANACEDFGRLVCSTWTNKHRGLAWSTLSQLVMDWMVNIEEAVAMTGHENDIMRRPMRFVHSCLHRQGSDEDAVTSLIQFVHNKSFAWPTEDDDSESLSYSRALFALVELAVRWALPLWFRIDLLPSRASRNRTLALKPSTIPIVWDNLHREMLSNQDVYPGYLYLFHSIFFAFRTPSPTYQKFLDESAVIQTHVLGNLSHAIREPVFAATAVELQQLPSRIAQLKADDWVNALQSAFNASPPIEEPDVLLATNGEVLAAVGRLFGAYDARSILYHTSWWFLQIVGVFTSDQLFNSATLYRLGTQFQKIVCAIHIEATDYLLLAAVSETKFPVDERRSIKLYLEHVHSTAVEKVRTSSRIRSPVKESLLSLLQRTTAVTWPDDASENGPRSNYSEYVFPYDDSNMFTSWRSLREGLQRSIVSEHHAAVAKLPRLDTRTVTWYDPLLEVISISFAAMVPPLHYESGTSAMLYGGLGFVYAREIVQAINVLTMLLEYDGDVNAPSNGSMRVTMWNNISCPDVEPSDVELLLASLPALEIAHAAYVTYRDGEHDLPLKGLEKFSAEQVFFLTLCLTACEVENSGQHSAPLCNVAVKNFEPFSRAFSCPPGSKMNREQKCRLF